MLLDVDHKKDVDEQASFYCKIGQPRLASLQKKHTRAKHQQLWMISFGCRRLDENKSVCCKKTLKKRKSASKAFYVEIDREVCRPHLFIFCVYIYKQDASGELGFNHQVINRPLPSLGHMVGQRVFYEGPKFFKLCPTHFQEGAKKF